MHELTFGDTEYGIPKKKTEIPTEPFETYKLLQTAKQDGFYVVGVHDSHESRQQELLHLADVYLSDYFELTSFWKFASAE